MGLFGPKIVEPHYHDLNRDLPSLQDYLGYLGFTPDDPVSAFVPKDVSIEVADRFDSDSTTRHLIHGQHTQKFLSDHVVPKDKNSWIIHMRTDASSVVHDMQKVMNLTIENPQRFNTIQGHLFILFHEVKHCGQPNGRISARETECDMNGVAAVKAQFPDSNIAKMIRNMRMIHNGYMNGMMLDYALKDDTTADMLALEGANLGLNGLMALHQQKINSVSPLHMVSQRLRETFHKAGTYKPLTTREKILFLNEYLKNNSGNGLLAEAARETLNAYRYFAPNLVDRTLGTKPQHTPKPIGFDSTQPV